MTVIIKSNEVSTKNMGNLFGLSKTDYSLLLDFNIGEYRTKAGGVITKTTLAEAISLTRASKATYINSNNELKEATINEPRIQHDKDTGKQGLLIENGFAELLTNPYLPATQTIQRTASVNDLLILTVKGSGSATVSGGVTANGGSTLTATEGVPATFAVTVSGGVTITVTGELEVFSMKFIYSTGGIQSLAFPPQGIADVAPDVCSLSSAMFDQVIRGRQACTVLLRIVQNTKSSYYAYTSGNNIFTLVNAQKTAGVYVYASTGRNRVYNATSVSNGTIIKNVNKSVNDNVRSHTYAYTFDNYGADAIAARNGEATVSNGAFDLRADKLIIGSQTGWNFSANLNGIITTLAVYPYKMTYEEMERLTANSL